jgi:NADP-dependent 3-hydroxy acid dehydrogenase YdfG
MELAWITGASSGIGRALALRLVKDGYKVAVTARDHEKLVELQSEARTRQHHRTRWRRHQRRGHGTGVLASIEYEHGAMALAVFNAGVYLPVHAEELKREDFEQSLRSICRAWSIAWCRRSAT